MGSLRRVFSRGQCTGRAASCHTSYFRLAFVLTHR
jgi:hypothetical protein